MKRNEDNLFGSFFRIAVSVGVVSSTPCSAKCHDTEVLKAEAHLAQLCEAAERGNVDAMYWLGLAYLDGQVLDNYDKGLAWLKKAAFRGNHEADQMYEFINSAQIGPGC